MSNKWDIQWQITRVNARLVKDYDDKFEFVIEWFKDNPTETYYKNVKNWIRMTSMGYKKSPDIWLNDIEEYVTENGLMSDSRYTPQTLSQTPDFLLERVYKDLSKRKYNFQFKGRIPKGHIEFVESLEEELSKRV